MLQSNTRHQPEPHLPPVSGTKEPFELDKIVSIQLIREQNKIEDVPAISDQLLELYRSAAFEAAERYTGWLLTHRKQIVEDIELPAIASNRYRRRDFFYHNLDSVPASATAFIYGQKNALPRKIVLKPGVYRQKIPLVVDSFGLGCCDPCSNAGTMKILYTSGFGCEADIPSLVTVGVLKYIAHLVENPGDIVVATNEVGKASSGRIGVTESSDPALASGAVNIWRSAVGTAI